VKEGGVVKSTGRKAVSVLKDANLIGVVKKL
jgi:hypothetical protein